MKRKTLGNFLCRALAIEPLLHTNPLESGQPLETSFGEEFAFRKTADETGGELLQIETRLNPGVRRPLHAHPRQDERFLVQESTLGLAIEDQELLLKPGAEKTVAAGTPHTFWRAGEGPMRMSTEHRPALRLAERSPGTRRQSRSDCLPSVSSDGEPMGAAARTDCPRRHLRWVWVEVAQPKSSITAMPVVAKSPICLRLSPASVRGIVRWTSRPGRRPPAPIMPSNAG